MIGLNVIPGQPSGFIDRLHRFIHFYLTSYNDLKDNNNNCSIARLDNGRHNVFLLQSVGTMQIEMSVTKLRRFIKIKVTKSSILFAHFQIRVSRF